MKSVLSAWLIAPGFTWLWNQSPLVVPLRGYTRPLNTWWYHSVLCKEASTQDKTATYFTSISPSRCYFFQECLQATSKLNLLSSNRSSQTHFIIYSSCLWCCGGGTFISLCNNPVIFSYWFVIEVYRKSNNNSKTSKNKNCCVWRKWKGLRISCLCFHDFKLIRIHPATQVWERS